MKKIGFIFLFLVTNLYAIDYHFTITEDIDVENNHKYASVPENTELSVHGEDFRTLKGQYLLSFANDDGIDEIFYYIDYNNESYLFDEDYLKMQNCNLETPEVLKNSSWIMSYYYEMLEKRKLNILLEYEPYSHLYPQFIDKNTNLDEWKNYFKPLKLKFGKYCLLGNQNNWSASLLELLFVPESYNKNIYTVNVQEVTHNNSYATQYQWRKMFDGEDSFKLIFKLDGDYLYVYKNEIDDLNILYELAKADNNSIEQIKNFIKTGEYDANSIKFPTHESNTEKIVFVNKIMTVKENLKLRKGEATTTDVLSVMASGTRVKIIKLGKNENIDNLNSKWVRVEVLPGSKDKNGNNIEEYLRGWCYSGYLE